MDVFTSAKSANTSKFWDKDVSKRQEFTELRPKFERCTSDETLGCNKIAVLGKLAQSGEQWQSLRTTL